MLAQPSAIRAHIIGRSKALVRALDRLERAARVPGTAILIYGETGTGKELAARLVHACSQRHGQFVAVNCATLPEDLMDSELFGHVRGAFTGAQHDHTGLFEQADGGTLFLDEIADMPAALQAKVLRAIQDGEIRRVGDTRVRTVDVHIVSATHRDLRAMVDKATFRDDLFYRLKDYVVRLPPLRARGRDVVQLARLFLREAFPSKRLRLDAEAVLRAYNWPGNIRELRSVIRAAGIDAGRTIRPEHLAEHLDHAAPDATPRSSRTDQMLAIVDQQGTAAPLELCTKMSLPRTTVGRALTGFVAAGVLHRLGHGRRTRYARTRATETDQRTVRHTRILRHAADTGRVTRHGCAQMTGTSLRTASRDLAALVRRGRLVPDSRTGNAAGYVPA